TQDLALWGELAKIADERGARLMYAVNSPDGERPDISAESLQRKIPDIDRHDVFMCGPPGFAQSVYEALRGAGVPARRIHHESFAMWATGRPRRFRSLESDGEVSPRPARRAGHRRHRLGHRAAAVAEAWLGPGLGRRG